MSWDVGVTRWIPRYNCKKGEPWKQDKETTEQAAWRELVEETGYNGPKEKMIKVGEYDKFGRDPRDNEHAWSKSTAFLMDLGETITPKVSGNDDAQQAKWISLKELPQLAFDHKKILIDALRTISSMD